MIAQLEHAIKQHIAGVKTDAKAKVSVKLPYLRTLATYGGEFDDDITKVVRMFPAIWIAYVGDDQPQTMNTARTLFQYKCRFAVMVGAYNPRNEEATRRGNKKGDGIIIGTYQMLKDVRELLTNFDPGENMAVLQPGRTKTLYSGKLNNLGLSVMAQEWHSAYLLGVQADGGLPPLDGININYHAPPDSPNPVALDIVTLNQGRKA